MSDFKIPDDAETLWGGPPERRFQYAQVGGKIVLRICWFGADICDAEGKTYTFGSTEEASGFIAGIDAALDVRWATQYRIVAPTDGELLSEYFETVEIDAPPLDNDNPGSRPLFG